MDQWMDQWTDQWTDGQTDSLSYRDARMHLKSGIHLFGAIDLQMNSTPNNVLTLT